MKYNNTVVKKMNFGGQKVKKWYHNGVKVFSSGNIVTYNVDTGTSYQEEVDSEATVLSPKTFTPTKSGYTFVGWREDKTASGSVLQSKIMGDDPITLYAVFRRTFTLSFANNYASGGSTSPVSGYQYYNNGNIANPTVTLPDDGYSRSGMTFLRWVLGTPGTSVTLTGNTSTRAVCKYDDIIPKYLSYANAGELWGEVRAVVDGTKYSQIYMGYYKVTSNGLIYVDKSCNTNTTYFTWIINANQFAPYTYTACAGNYDGYNTQYLNGQLVSGFGAIEKTGEYVDLPNNSVYFGAYTDTNAGSARTAKITGIKLIGRTVQ